LSSTTDRKSERGQALLILVGAVAALLLVAALAFDVGMIMLEKRDDQNAADAAALAGVACLLQSPPNTACAQARATQVARENVQEKLSDPDPPSIVVGVSRNRVQVQIQRDMPALFAPLAGIFNWHVSALAVALAQTDAPPFAAMQALNPTACPALAVTGTGVITTHGDVQINSNCPDQALLISGQGNLVFREDGLSCWVVGGHQISGKGSGSLCDPPNQGVAIPFPIPPFPPSGIWPKAAVQVAGSPKAVPNGCPGSAAPSTDAVPVTCQFQASYKGTTWRLFPGYYPGGIKLQGVTVYLEPGIYYLAGGGFTVTGTGTSATSVDPGGTTLGGGVMFFNTTHPIAAPGPITMGGNGATFNFYPLGGLNENCSGPTSGWERYLVFQDPAVTLGMVINGGSNDMNARGLILVPSANVKVNGGTGTLTLDAIVADTFVINGNGGNINVLYDSCALPTFTGYGLVM
jgi:hypothetical protein